MARPPSTMRFLMWLGDGLTDRQPEVVEYEPSRFCPAPGCGRALNADFTHRWVDAAYAAAAFDSMSPLEQWAADGHR